jgi:hypothetical protein
MRPRTPTGSPVNRGAVVVEFLVAGIAFTFALFAIVQLALLWAGQGAVETAAHFAARKFAVNARQDVRKAKEAALTEASAICRNRPGGRWEGASITSVDFSREGGASAPARTLPGEAYCVRLTHGVELVVPWVNRILYAIAPVRKVRIGGRHYLILHATRWVTVE